MSKRKLIPSVGPLSFLSALEPLPAVFLVACVISAWRFGPWMPDVFFGDDLANLIAFREGHLPAGFWDSLTSGYAGKFRPLFTATLASLMGVFDTNIQVYLFINVALHALNACLVYLVSYVLSGNNKVISFTIAVVIAASRFGLYQVTQVTGLLEGMAFTLFLCNLLCLTHYAKPGQKHAMAWGVGALVCIALAIHVHERYAGVIVWAAISFIFLPSVDNPPLAKRFALAAFGFAILAFNILYKENVLQMPFLMGTGSQTMSLNLVRLLDHSMQACFSVFQFNEGPEYLTATRAISSESWPVAGLATVFLLLVGLIFTKGVRQALHEAGPSLGEKLSALKWPLVFAALFALLLGPVLLTIRVEQRWLLQPFTVVLFAVAWAARQNGARNWVDSCLVICIGAVSLLIESSIAKYNERIFFIYSGIMASRVHKAFVQDDSLQNDNTNLVMHPDHVNWTLLNNSFFSVYTPLSRKIRAVADLDDVDITGNAGNTRVFTVTDQRIDDITADILLQKDLKDNAVKYDFIRNYEQGELSNPSAVETPSGRASMILSFERSSSKNNLLGLVSGFSTKYRDIKIAHGDLFICDVSSFHPSAYEMEAGVRVKSEKTGDELTYTRKLPPKSDTSSVRFKPIIIPLGHFEGDSISLEFLADTPPGNNSAGHWAVFKSPRIVSRPPNAQIYQRTLDAESVLEHRFGPRSKTRPSISD